LLLLPERALRRLLLVRVAVGPVSRWLPLAMGWKSPNFAGLLLPASFDFFALGSAVAMLSRENLLDRLCSRAQLRWLLSAAASWLLLGSALKTLGKLPYYWCVYDALLQGIGFAFLLVYFLRFPDSRFAAFVRWRPFVYLGQISYGLYIWHNLMHRFGPSLLRRITGEAYFAVEAAHVGYYIVLTILTSVISFHLFESPARRLGQKLAAAKPGAPVGLFSAPRRE
jgi:peptidoglycan/LPS O-acetylase OafA/YrhL